MANEVLKAVRATYKQAIKEAAVEAVYQMKLDPPYDTGALDMSLTAYANGFRLNDYGLILHFKNRRHKNWITKRTGLRLE